MPGAARESVVYAAPPRGTEPMSPTALSNASAPESQPPPAMAAAPEPEPEPEPELTIERALAGVLSPEPIGAGAPTGAELAEWTTADLRAKLEALGTDSSGLLRAELLPRLEVAVAAHAVETRARDLLELCRLAYEDQAHIRTIVGRDGVMRRLVAWSDVSAQPHYTVLAASTALLHTMCGSTEAVEKLASIPGSAVVFARLLESASSGETVRRVAQDAAGLIHKLAHGDALCRRSLLTCNIVPVMLRFLAHSQPYCDLGQLRSASAGVLAEGATACGPTRGMKPEELAPADLPLREMDGGGSAASERVVEECLGTLRNLTQHRLGWDALADEAVPTLVKIVRDRVLFTQRLCSDARHVVRYRVSEQTFERVQVAALGTLHNMVAAAEQWREQTIDAHAVAVLVDMLQSANHLAVHAGVLSLLHSLVYNSLSTAHVVEMGAPLLLVELLVTLHGELAADHRKRSPKVASRIHIVAETVELTLSILANIVFYSPRNTEQMLSANQHGASDHLEQTGPAAVIAAGALSVVVSLLTPKIVDVPGSVRYGEFLSMTEAGVSMLRNLAFHDDCVAAITGAGTISVLVEALNIPGASARAPKTSLAHIESVLGCLHNLLSLGRARLQMLGHQWIIKILADFIAHGATQSNAMLQVSGSMQLCEALGCLRHLALEKDFTGPICDSGVLPALVKVMQESDKSQHYKLAAAVIRNLVTDESPDTDRARNKVVEAGATTIFVNVMLVGSIPAAAMSDEKAQILQNHAVASLAQICRHPVCQRQIVDAEAIKPAARILKRQSAMLATSGSDWQIHDLLLSLLILLQKLCDFPQSKAAVAAENLASTLVTIVKNTNLPAAVLQTAHDILRSLMGNTVDKGWLPSTTNNDRLTVIDVGEESQHIDENVAIVPHSGGGDVPSSAATSYAMRRSVLSDLLALEIVEQQESSNQQSGDSVMDDLAASASDGEPTSAGGVIAKLAKPVVKSESNLYMRKPITIMRNGQQFLVESDSIPTKKWDIGCACFLVLVLIVTICSAIMLHADYVIEGYTGTTDEVGDLQEATTTTKTSLDVVDSADPSKAWSYDPTVGSIDGAPIFVVIRCCVLGGLVATVALGAVCHPLAAGVDRAAPLVLLSACLWWLIRADRDDLECNLASWAWWIGFGWSAAAAPQVRVGRQLAVAYFHSCQLVLANGDPWMVVVLLLIVWVQVLWLMLWMAAFSGTLCLDGEKQAGLRAMLVLVLGIVLYWTHQIFQRIAHVVAVACAVEWYRGAAHARDATFWRRHLCCKACGGRPHATRAAWRALQDACTISLGSICLASVLSGPLNILRILLPQPRPRRHHTSKRNWPGPGADNLRGIKYLPALPDLKLCQRAWDSSVAFYDATVRCCWHLLDGSSKMCNLAALAFLPATRLGPTGPKVSGAHADVAPHAWRYSNETGVQPLRQSPFFFLVIVAAACSGGCFTAGVASAWLSADYGCGTLGNAVTLCFLCGWLPVATALSAVEGTASSMLILAVEQPEPMLTKNARMYAAVIVSMEMSTVRGHLNIPGNTVRVAPEKCTRRVVE